MGFKMVGLIFLVVGILFTLSAILKKKSCTSTIEGKVIDISRERQISHNSRDRYGSYTNSGELAFYPVFEYSVNGNIYIKKSSSGSSTSKYFIGQSIDIHYNPQNPNQYYVNPEFTTRMFSGIISTIVGLICIIAL